MRKKRIGSFALACITALSLFSINNIKAEAETLQAYPFDFTGDVQEITIPITGIYKLECWGAGWAMGGKGSYAKGEVELEKGDVIYIYCGGNNGFNGGGAGASASAGGANAFSSTGCGATDMRLVKSTATDKWSGTDSLNSRIVTAGGGSAYGYYNYSGSTLTYDTDSYGYRHVYTHYFDTSTKMGGYANAEASNLVLGFGTAGRASIRHEARSDDTGFGGASCDGYIPTLALAGGGGYYGAINGYVGTSYVPSTFLFTDTDGFARTLTFNNAVKTLGQNSNQGYARVTLLEVTKQGISDMSVLDTDDAIYEVFYNKTNSDPTGTYEYQYYNVATETWDMIGTISCTDMTPKTINIGDREYTLKMIADEKTGYLFNYLTLNEVNKETDNGLRFKCVATGSGTIFESESTLTVLKNGYSKIKAAYYSSVEAGTLMKASDITMIISYQTGTGEIATNLSNLYIMIDKNKDGVEEPYTEYNIPYGENKINVKLVDTNPIWEEGIYKDNTVVTTLKVHGVDTKAPVIMSSKITYPEGFTVVNSDPQPTEITFDIVAQDMVASPSEIQYCITEKNSLPTSYENGTESGYTKKLTFTENKELKLWVKDVAGNETSMDLDKITILDNIYPELLFTMSPDDGSFTRNILFVGTATDNYTGSESLQYQFIHPDGSNDGWQTGNVLKNVTENGTYTLNVKDVAGNVTTKSLVASGIDVVSPEISVKKVQSIDNSIVLQITITDDGSGLMRYAANSDVFESITGKTFTKSITVSNSDVENGIQIFATDAVQNISSYTYKNNFVNVQFYNYDGSLLNTQVIESGENALAPTAPLRSGYTFTGWDTPLQEIKADTKITAVFIKAENSTKTIVNTIYEQSGTTPSVKVTPTVRAVSANEVAVLTKDKLAVVLSDGEEYKYYPYSDADSGNTTSDEALYEEYAERSMDPIKVSSQLNNYGGNESGTISVLDKELDLDKVLTVSALVVILTTTGFVIYKKRS